MLSADLLPQLQAHLGGGFESEGFVERSALIAGVEGDAGEILLAAPDNHGLHQAAGDALAAEFGIDIHVQDRGGAALLIVRMAEPWADIDQAAAPRS